jgi:hypothetical protein
LAIWSGARIRSGAMFAGMHEIARGLSKLAPIVERIADQRD